MRVVVSEGLLPPRVPPPRHLKYLITFIDSATWCICATHVKLENFVTEINEHQVHFQKQGHLVGALGWSHIVLLMDLKNITHEINQMCGSLLEMVILQPHFRKGIFESRFKSARSFKDNLIKAQVRWLEAVGEN